MSILLTRHHLIRKTINDKIIIIKNYNNIEELAWKKYQKKRGLLY